MSPSASVWSRPTRCPSNFADGPVTRAPVHDSASSWWTARAASTTVAPGASACASPRSQTRIKPVSSQSCARSSSRLSSSSTDTPIAGRPRRAGDLLDSRLVGLVELCHGDQRALLDPGRFEFGTDRPELRDRRVRRVAEHDRVGAAQDAEQRLAAAAILGGTRNQAGDLDELHAAVVDSLTDGTGRVVVNA